MGWWWSRDLNRQGEMIALTRQEEEEAEAICQLLRDAEARRIALATSVYLRAVPDATGMEIAFGTARGRRIA